MMEINELSQVFSEIVDPETMMTFFNEIFTESERKDLSLRWQLMKMLHEDVPQREIAARLKVSLCKITRGVKIVKDPNSVTRHFMDKNHPQVPGVQP